MVEIKEEWRFVLHKGDAVFAYQISNLGNVRRLGLDGKCLPLKTRINQWGYEQVNITIKGKSYTKQIHRMVAETFLGYQDAKKQVNHIDGNKLNNTLSNLEWATSRENMEHARKNNLLKKKRNNLTSEEKTAIVELVLQTDLTYQQIADVFGISRRTVFKVLNKKATPPAS